MHAVPGNAVSMYKAVCKCFGVWTMGLPSRSQHCVRNARDKAEADERQKSFILGHFVGTGIEGRTARRRDSHRSAMQTTTSALDAAGSMGSMHTSAECMTATMGALMSALPHGRILMHRSRTLLAACQITESGIALSEHSTQLGAPCTDLRSQCPWSGLWVHAGFNVNTVFANVVQ